MPSPPGGDDRRFQFKNRSQMAVFQRLGWRPVVKIDGRSLCPIDERKWAPWPCGDHVIHSGQEAAASCQQEPKSAELSGSE